MLFTLHLPACGARLPPESNGVLVILQVGGVAIAIEQQADLFGDAEALQIASRDLEPAVVRIAMTQ